MTETLSLVPWAEQKIVRFARWLSVRHDVGRRLKEYEQFQQWTQSRLQVSTALDWGHTCDIAEAINESAKDVLGASRLPCWAFTSRVMVSKALQRYISPCLWKKVVRFAIYVNHNSPADKPVMEWIRASGESNPFKAYLRARWILYDEYSDESSDCIIAPTFFCAPSVLSRNPFEASSSVRKAGRKRLQQENIAVKGVIDLIEDIYRVYYNGVELKRSCKQLRTLRDRALQNEPCGGVTIQFRSDQSEPLFFDANAWSEMTTLWRDFVGHWNEITSTAAKRFPFPVIPNLDELVFHDMATGLVASSKMFRTGGVFTSEKGTTLVHPSEQAVIVSSACTIVRNRYSTLDMNGVLRKWHGPAEEFAQYALLRCDLVSRSSWTFKDAVRDWESQYTSWDRAPKSLSEWSKVDDERSCDLRGLLPDDYRLLLLRQALGRPHSIEIVIAPGTEGSILGGYLRDANQLPENLISDKVIVIDQAMKLNVKVNTGLYAFGKDARGIRDRWGGTRNLKRDQHGYYNKVLEETGKPTILRVVPGATFSYCKESLTTDEQIVFW